MSPHSRTDSATALPIDGTPPSSPTLPQSMAPIQRAANVITAAAPTTTKPMPIQGNHHVELSSLNGDSSRYAQNRRGHSAQDTAKTIGRTLLVFGVVGLAAYVLYKDHIHDCSCDEEGDFGRHGFPINEKDGILMLNWESLPLAIRSFPNLALIEYNAQCGPFNISSLSALRCEQMTLATMPHSTFTFRSNCADKSPCYGMRWFANQLDTYHGPFVDIADLEQWFDSVTGVEYGGCLGKAASPIANLTFRR